MRGNLHRPDVNVHKQSERLRLLSDAAGLLLTSAEPDTMLRELFSKLASHLELDTFFNYMVDETGDALQLASCSGVPGHAARSICRLEFGEAICGTVAERRQSIVTNYIQQSSDPKAQLVKAFGIRVSVCNPLMAGDRLLGTLSFASRSKDEFEPDELEFIQTICRYVAAAYERLDLINQLQLSDRRKDEFLATLAHELRNPLAPLRNGLQIMQLARDNAEVFDETATVMERQLHQLVHLIDDLLDVSRITRGKLKLHIEPVELALAARNAIEISRPLIDAVDHELTLTIPSEPIFVQGDVTRLIQVFSNLLNNAAKYSERDGHIWLIIERDENEVLVKVKDKGIGIPAEYLPHVFDMFAQVDRSLDRSQGGLGLGLTIVQRLVEMHGGSVEVHSDGPGTGSEFIVRLPTTTAPPEQPKSSNRHSKNETCAEKRTVLVVDDNHDSVASLSTMLRIMGFDVYTANDGVQGIQEAATHQPKVVLLDISLPRLNGYEAARRIRQQPWGKGIRLVALTGWGQEEDKKRAIAAGFDQHIVKPVEPAALEKLLTTLCIN